MVHTHANCTDVGTYAMEIPKRPEDTRGLMLGTQRPIDTFQEDPKAPGRSVEDIGDTHAVLTEIFSEKKWDVSRLYQSHRLDIQRGFPGWFVNRKVERCDFQARTDYHFSPLGNVVMSGESVYEDLEECDGVAYRSMFEMVS